MTDIIDEVDPNSHQSEASLGLPMMEFDYEVYRDEMSKYDIPEEQAKELLSALFYIIHTLVDIDMGLDITQVFNIEQSEKTGQDSGNTLLSEDTLLLEPSKTSFNEAAQTIINKED